jgi:hypothetical protein
MRKELAKLVEQRKSFTGVFIRYGFKNGWKGKREETVLIKDIIEVDTGIKITDHLWFNLTKEFANLYLTEGDRIEFHARAKAYRKGYVDKRFIDNRRTDYKLSHPTKVKKL